MRVWLLACAVLAGLLQAASIAWPFDAVLPYGQPVGSLQVLSLAVLVGLLQRAQRPSQGFLLAWAFATTWICGTVWWLFISMHTYGGLAAPLAALAVLALAAALGAYYGLAGAVFYAFFKHFGQLVSVSIHFFAIEIVVFSSLWTLAELARAALFTGFPWGAGGYAHVDGSLAAWAPWVGVYGMGWLAAAAACAVALLAGGLLNAPRQASLGGGVFVVALVLSALLPRWLAFANPAPSLQTAVRVELLQANLAQHEKFVRKGIDTALDWYASRLHHSTAQLVIAPETAIPVLPHQLPEGYLAALHAKFTGPQAALIGAPLVNAQGYTNSVIGLGAAAPYRYDKHHLVPFGEFIPPFFKWFVRMMNIPLGDFERGALAQASFVVAGQRFAPNICYEDLFGEEMAKSFANPATAPNVMVNFSNIGWFGNGIAIDQHLHISRMRTLEFARPMLRATNTGSTVAIDHLGRVTHQLPRAAAASLRASVVPAGGGTTPYAQWASRFGLWPLVCAALAVLGAAMVLTRRLQARRE